MTPNQLRQAYLDFFRDKGHAVIPSAPLVPDNDPTTLFTGSGMQPMMPYLMGQPHAKGTRIVDSQKCFRSQDIEEVGDNRHTTFFEMLGNWSLGDYFKEEQLTWCFTFLTESLQLDPQKLYVSVFRGLPDQGISRDDEAVAIWQKLFAQKGIKAETADRAEEKGLMGGRIFFYNESKNWWSRAGAPGNMPVGEPGGPDSEVFYDFGAELKLHESSPFKDEVCHINCDCGRFMEIGNSVFMTYVKTLTGFEPLAQKNIDFGGGFERLLAAKNNHPDVFTTDLFRPIMQYLSGVSGQDYQTAPEEVKRSFRVIADHMRAVVMLAADGVFPSNKEQGYFARRLLRRSVRFGKMIGINQAFISDLVPVISTIYADPYPEVQAKSAKITEILAQEEAKFSKTLQKGLKEFDRLFSQEVPPEAEVSGSGLMLTGEKAFEFYETYGFPLELSIEEAKNRGLELETEIEKSFTKAKEVHADQSRSASVGMFKGGLQDHSEVTVKYHTVTHLLHAALRQVLGTQVQQKGSNITGERLRFDFSYAQALTDDEKTRVLDLVNGWILEDLPVTHIVMPKAEALESGAVAFFIEKYPDEVSVYTIGRDSQTDWVSKEFCGGPHVEHTGVIGSVKLTKEQAVSAGVRRIYMELA